MLIRPGRVGRVGRSGRVNAAQRWALDATAEQIRSAIADITRYGYSDHNLITQCCALNNAAWTAFAATVTGDNVLAPDGTLTADTLTSDGTTSGHFVYPANVSVSAGERYTFSVYVRAGAGRYISLRGISTIASSTNWPWITFDTQTQAITTNGLVLASGVVPLPNGWFRVWLSWTQTASTSTTSPIIALSDVATAPAISTSSGNSFTSAGVSMALWGAQLNLGAVPLGLVQTTTTALGLTAPGWLLPGTSGARLLASARASVAMQQTVAGAWEFAPHNLLTFSEAIDNAAWTKSAATVSVDAVVAPSGAQTGDILIPDATTAQHYATRTYAGLNAGTSHAFSVYARAAGRNWLWVYLGGGGNGSNCSAYFDLQNGVTGTVGAGATASIVAVGGGWFRCIVIGAPVSATLSPELHPVTANNVVSNLGDGVNGVAVWGHQLNFGPAATAYVPTTTAAVYAPAISWNAATSRFLVQQEPQRTNAIRNSAMVGAASGSPGTLPTTGWSLYGGLTSTVTAGLTLLGLPAIAIRLQGTLTGEAGIQFDTVFAAAASGQAWSASAFVALQAGSTANIASANFILSEHNAGGTYLTGSVQPYTPGAVQRLILARTLNQATTASAQAYLNINCTGAVDITLLIACPQLEQGANASSPILTYGSTATRMADLPVAVGLPSSSAYTMVADIVPTLTSGTPVDIRLSDGTSANWIGHFVSGGTPGAQSFAAGVDLGSASPGGSVTAGTLYRVAIAAEANRLALSVNGGAVSTRASGAVPGGLNRVEFAGAGTERAYGLARIRVRGGTTAAANAELQALAA